QKGQESEIEAAMVANSHGSFMSCPVDSSNLALTKE
ncbi:MAG: hypothetical protein ACI9VS_004512, partial [Candidatus Binatia bacterium]